MMTSIYCIECQRDVQARLTTGEEVYNHRVDLHHLPFWICDNCKNFVGCHHQTKNSIRPLGCIPNAEMKNARKHIHLLLDPIWKSGLMKREKVYSFVSKQIGKNYHTAELRTIEEARNVYRILLKLKKSLEIETSSSVKHN